MSYMTENYLPSPSTLKAGFRYSPYNAYLSRRAVLEWFAEMSSRNFDRCFGCACRLWFGDPSWNWTTERIGNLEIKRENKPCIREKKKTSSVFSSVVFFPLCKPECAAFRTVCLNVLHFVGNETEASYLTYLLDWWMSKNLNGLKLRW